MVKLNYAQDRNIGCMHSRVGQFTRHKLLLTLLLFLFGLFWTPAPAAQPEYNESKIISAFVNHLNHRHFDKIAAMFSSDALSEGKPNQVSGFDTFHNLILAIPDLTFVPGPATYGEDHSAILLTGQGHYRGPLLGDYLPLNIDVRSGVPVHFDIAVFFRFKQEKISQIQTIVDKLSIIQQATWSRASDVPFIPGNAEEVAVFPPGSFPESIAIGPDGNLYITLLGDNAIRKVTPEGQISVFSILPIPGDTGDPYAGPFCLVFDPEGTLYVSVNSSDAGAHGVWSVKPNGKAIFRAAMPLGTQPNGITMDDNHNIYVADSSGGSIWKVASEGNNATIWLRDDIIDRREYIGEYPAPNGVQYWDGAIYATNSDKGNVVRIPIASDGLAGSPTLFASAVPGDDFAIGPEGTLFITTHPLNSVVRVKQNGKMAMIASSSQNVIGPTAAALANENGLPILYIIGDGGLFAPLEGRAVRPNIVRLRLP